MGMWGVGRQGHTKRDVVLTKMKQPLVHDVHVKKKMGEQIRHKEGRNKDRPGGGRVTDRRKEFFEEANTNCKLGGKEFTERKKKNYGGE
jgi:hypothetical protein